MSDAAAQFAARYGETLDGLGTAPAASDNPLGFDPADYAEEPLPPLPELGTPERERLDRDQAAMVAGLLHVARVRPSSWRGEAARPFVGCFCADCGGKRWWCGDGGWHCAKCHPMTSLSCSDDHHTHAAAGGSFVHIRREVGM
jgi:hypothetical protein